MVRRFVVLLAVVALFLSADATTTVVFGGSQLPPGSPMRVDPNVDPPKYDGEGIVDCGLEQGWMLPEQFGVENIPKTLDGQVVQSHIASDDFVMNHGTKDFNFFVYPDKPFRFLLSTANFDPGVEAADIELGRIEVEWEIASNAGIDPARRAGFPSWAWPTQGDRVHVVGSHIADCGHDPKRAEIHAPRLVATYRNAAQDNFAGASNRQGSSFTFTANNGLPTAATRVDVFGSSYGGESVEEEYDNQNIDLSELYHHDEGPQSNPQTWWQPINDRDYSFVIMAPPKPFPGATLIHQEVAHPVKASLKGGQLAPASSPAATFDPLPTGDGYTVTLLFSQVPETFFMVYANTIYVGWGGSADQPNTVVPNLRHYRVSIEKIHIFESTDGVTGCGEFSIGGYVNERGRRLLSGSFTDSLEETYRSRCNGEDFPSAAYGENSPDDAINNRHFDVTLVDGQPLRVHFRGIDYETVGAHTNDELGTAEDIWIGDDSAWTNMDHTVVAGHGGVMGGEDTDEDCFAGNNNGCYSVTYHIARLDPPATTLGVLSPNVVVGATTWVTSATTLFTSVLPSPSSVGPLTQQRQFWHFGLVPPGPTACADPICFFHIDSNDGADGPYTLLYWTGDGGNGTTEPPHSRAIGLDNTPPISSALVTTTSLPITRGWYRVPVDVTLFANDGPGVGGNSIAYDLDGGPTSNYTAPFTVTTESASHLVTFSSHDALGNAEAAPNSTSFKIDKTVPHLAVTGGTDGAFSYTGDEVVNGLFTNSTTLIVGYGAGDPLSGLYEVRLGGQSSVATHGSFGIALAPGVSTFTLEAEDVAGNVSQISFQVVSIPPGTFVGGPAPQGAGFWKNAVSGGNYSTAQLGIFLDETNVASQAFGPKLNRYEQATLANYLGYLMVSPNADINLKVRRDLLAAWLNFMSGREPAGTAIDVKKVSDWMSVVQNNGSSSNTTALNLVREIERRLGESPSPQLLQTIMDLLNRLNTGNLQ